VKWNLARLIVLMVLVVSMRSAAQEQPASMGSKKHYSRYKLIDLGTFGGPQSYIADGADITAVRVLNNKGIFTGWADTSASDPFPDFCWDDDCLVAHAFLGDKHRKKDLGVLPGGASSDTTWIADNGLISGDSQNGEIDPLIPGLPEVRAVLWQRGHMIDLGTLDGGYESLSMSVNSRGQVAGLATTGVTDPNSMVGLGYQTRAFIWQHGAMHDLGTLGSGTDAIAGLINEGGQVVGWSYIDSSPSDTCAGVYGFPLSTGSFLWQEGKGLTDLGGLGGTCTVATDLNNRGEVVGQSWSHADLTGHAFLWDHKNGLIDLGTLGGDFSSATAINNNGQAVGGSYLSDNVRIDATLWKGRAAVDLGTVDADTCSYALSINALAQVVGISGTTNCESFRPFLWDRSGPMVDLNSLISPNAGIYVTFASQINDQGEIVGVGVLPSGDERAVLLVPCQDDDQACAVDATGKAAAPGTSAFSRQRPPVGPGRARPSRVLRRPPSLSRVPGLVFVPPSPLTSTLGRSPWPVQGEVAAHDHEQIDSGFTPSPATAKDADGVTASNYILGDKLFPWYVVRGSCNVDPRTGKLTGGCVGPQGLHCVGKRDPVNCPAGQKAQRPEWVQMCVYGRPYVDLAKSCSAL